MGLRRVWVQSLADGLVRADQITGIDAHQTPAFAGKPVRWLLDVVLAVPIGNGRRDEWTVSALHRTLIQTAHDPSPATTALARLLAQLDVVDAAGIITASVQHPDDAAAARARRGADDGEAEAAVAGGVRFRFTPFAEPAPGRHTGAEYL